MKCKRRLMLALVLAALTVPSGFPHVFEARRAFASLQRAFERYDALLRRTAPAYNPTAPSGPPFDMWYSLEQLDRCRANLTALMDESRTWWETLAVDRG